MEEVSSHGTDRTTDNEKVAKCPEPTRSLGKSTSLPAKVTSNAGENRFRDRREILVNRGTARSVPESVKTTLCQHYYPEGGWGWVVTFAAFIVNVWTTGLQFSFGTLLVHLMKHFHVSLIHAAWLGAVCLGSSLVVVPLIVAVCRQRSIRILSIVGGLVVSLGCLFTSFATKYHQIFLSFGFFLGIGIGITRETADLMIGQYFKRRRELVEIITHSGNACGLVLYSVLYKVAIPSIGWRLALQSVTGMAFTTFVMGLFYRSASLYHPQRRAIQHLKNQRRKVKEKASHKTEKLPFFDFSVLRTKCLRVLMFCSTVSSMGIYTPLIYLVYILKEESLDEMQILLLQIYMGIAMIIGYILFGYIAIQNSPQCQIGRLYLVQISLLCTGVSIIAFCSLQGYYGYVLCVFMYGAFFGGYSYSIKIFLYEKVKTKNFAKAWSFLQGTLGIPAFLGIGLTGHIMAEFGAKTGLYFSMTAIFCSSLLHIIISSLQSQMSSVYRDGHRTLVNEQSGSLGGSQKASVDKYIGCSMKTDLCNCHKPHSNPAIIEVSKIPNLVQGVEIYEHGGKRPECMTCISEEGLLDNYLLDEMYHENCITSCNKVEKYLMMSEYENNIHSKTPIKSRNSLGVSQQDFLNVKSSRIKNDNEKGVFTTTSML